MTRRGFSEQAFFVMSALAAGPMHGYAIVSEVADLSGGRLRLRVGTLYGILDRLAADDVIEVDHEEIVDSRLRRYYRLAANGRQALAGEAARQTANAKIAVSRLAAASKRAQPARRQVQSRNDPVGGTPTVNDQWTSSWPSTT